MSRLTQSLILLIGGVLLHTEIASAAFVCRDLFASPGLRAEQYAEALGIQRTKDIWGRILWSRYLKKWNDQKSYTPATFEESLRSSYTILHRLRQQQGLTTKVEDYHARPEEVVRWAESALLRDGLSSYLGVSENAGVRDRLVTRLRTIFERKPIQLLLGVTSGNLAHKADRPVPPDLLARIMVDGVDRHLPELMLQYKVSGQNRVETYQRFRTFYRYAFLLVSFVISIDHFEQKAEEQAAETKREFISDLDSIDKGLTNLEQMIDAGEFD